MPLCDLKLITTEPSGSPLPRRVSGDDEDEIDSHHYSSISPSGLRDLFDTERITGIDQGRLDKRKCQRRFIDRLQPRDLVRGIEENVSLHSFESDHPSRKQDDLILCDGEVSKSRILDEHGSIAPRTAPSA